MRGLRHLLTAALLLLVVSTAHAKESTEALVEQLGNNDYKVRNPAYSELIRRKDPKAVSLLISKLPGWSSVKRERRSHERPLRAHQLVGDARVSGRPASIGDGRESRIDRP